MGAIVFFSVLFIVIVYLNYDSNPSVTLVSPDWEKSVVETRDFLKSEPSFCSGGVAPVIGWRKLK